jgi:hypothetical protein
MQSQPTISENYLISRKKEHLGQLLRKTLCLNTVCMLEARRIQIGQTVPERLMLNLTIIGQVSKLIE